MVAQCLAQLERAPGPQTRVGVLPVDQGKKAHGACRQLAPFCVGHDAPPPPRTGYPGNSRVLGMESARASEIRLVLPTFPTPF